MPILNTPSRDRPLHVSREARPSTPDARLPVAAPAQLETHWTRVLHHDLEAPWKTPDPRDDGATHRVIPVRGDPREDSRHEAYGTRTPVVAGVLLLGFYVALYLAVSAVIRIFTHEDALLAQPAGSSADRPATSALPRASTPPAPPYA